MVTKIMLKWLSGDKYASTQIINGRNITQKYIYTLFITWFISSTIFSMPVCLGQNILERNIFVIIKRINCFLS